MGPLLPRLLDLLRGFIARSHASLASVGVAAYTRMVASCGAKLDNDAWQQVRRMAGCTSLRLASLSVHGTRLAAPHVARGWLHLFGRLASLSVHANRHS
jgi:brefeldin A-inhibited guanine nucleotide-exchange protein